MVLDLLGKIVFFLNDEEPHLKQTIFPPKDRSETMSVHPQFKQILIFLIIQKYSFYFNYIINFICKEKLQ